MAILNSDQRRLLRAQAFLDQRQRDIHELLIGAIDHGLVDKSVVGAGRFPWECINFSYPFRCL